MSKILYSFLLRPSSSKDRLASVYTYKLGINIRGNCRREQNKLNKLRELKSLSEFSLKDDETKIDLHMNNHDCLLTGSELTKGTEEDKMIRLDRTMKNLVQAVKEVA